EARRIGRRVVASIFVNPTQFGPNEDFSRYPRDLEADLALLGQAGADAAWTPAVETMYPPGFATRIDVAGLTDGLCGPFRPGRTGGRSPVRRGSGRAARLCQRDPDRRDRFAGHGNRFADHRPALPVLTA
ncbi:pantoate--beta-alanine ligase, partial [Marinobacter sp. 1Y8]